MPFWCPLREWSPGSARPAAHCGRQAERLRARKSPRRAPCSCYTRRSRRWPRRRKPRRAFRRRGVRDAALPGVLTRGAGRLAASRSYDKLSFLRRGRSLRKLCVERHAGRCLLRLLLGPARPPSERHARRGDLHLEDAGVLRAGRVEDVGRWGPAMQPLQALLQLGLVVAGEGPRRGGVEVRGEQPVDERDCGVETTRKVDGGNDRFERVGEQALLLAAAAAFLAATEEEERAEIDVPRYVRERIGVDEACPDPREIALRRIGKPLVAADRDRQAEDGIPQELEPLVGSEHLAGEAALVDEAPVPQRLQRDVGPDRSRRPPEPLFEEADAIGVAGAVRAQKALPLRNPPQVRTASSATVYGSTSRRAMRNARSSSRAPCWASLATASRRRRSRRISRSSVRARSVSRSRSPPPCWRWRWCVSIAPQTSLTPSSREATHLRIWTSKSSFPAAPTFDWESSNIDRRSRTVRSAPSRSALLTTNRSATSRMPALIAWMSSPSPGTTTTTVVWARRQISTSSCPTPTVSMRITSLPMASSTRAQSLVARERPPSCPRVARERMKTPVSSA